MDFVRKISKLIKFSWPIWHTYFVLMVVVRFDGGGALCNTPGFGMSCQNGDQDKCENRAQIAVHLSATEEMKQNVNLATLL